MKAFHEAGHLEASLKRRLPSRSPSPGPAREEVGRLAGLPAPLAACLPVLSLSRINEKSVWCCGWLPCTPLRIAATAGHGNCVDFLIRKGAEVDLVDVKGQTALYVAVVNGHLESAQILLEAGADPNGSRHHRSTPVYHASRVGRADILKALIRSVPQGLGPHCPAMAATGSVAASAGSRSPMLISCVLYLPFLSLSLQLDLLEDLSVLLVFLKSCFLALSVFLFFLLTD